MNGWLVIEDWRLPWNGKTFDPDRKLILCGELGHIRWILFRVAARAAARHDLDTLLTSFAQRVGVEYHSSQRRAATPHNDHNGGNP